MRRWRFTRRAAVLTSLAAAACSRPTAPQSNDDRAMMFFGNLRQIEARIGGRVGVAALHGETGAWLTHRAQERFAMCSSFKWLAAAAVLNSVQNGGLTLDQQVRYGEADLVGHAPTARANIARGWMSVEECCEAAVVESDNTAANLLLEGMMGPAGLTHFLRANGDGVTRLDRTEPALNENLPGDPRDTSTPDAMVRTLRHFLTTDQVLNAPLREKLIGWMMATNTGARRVRAGFPATWRAGDKTGTSIDTHNATNDVVIAWPPGRAPVFVVVYLSDSVVEFEARNAAHAEIGRIIGEMWS